MSQEIRIKDGTGKSFFGKVNRNNRQVVEAVTSDVGISSLINGNSFTFSSGVVTSTNTTEVALLYFAHSEIAKILLGRRLILWSSGSTGGTESTMQIKFYLNSTGITGGSTFTPIANSVGSSKILSGDFQRGAFGATLNGGTAVTTHIVEVGKPYIFEFSALYQKDVSLGVTVIPPAGNTNIDLSFVINAELLDEDIY